MSEPSTTDRRRVLSAVAGLAAALSGCSTGDGTTTTAAETTTTTTEPTSTTTTTATETTTTTTAAETTTVGREELAVRARELVELLAAGEYEQARSRFAERARSQVTAAALEQAWAGIVGQRGPLVELGAAEPTTVQRYRGVILTAQFVDGPLRLRVLFDDAGAAVGFNVLPPSSGAWSPPPYAPTDAVVERETTVPATDDCSLPGRLTLPDDADGPVPGVVIVGGSGPTDVDGTVGPNKPLKDLAWGLAAEGVAALRYDKRTRACQVDGATITIDGEVTDDAVAALDVLGAADEVSTVAVAGHSLGGTLTPRIVERSDAAAGALLAAPARPLHDLVLAQTRYLAGLDGTVTDDERARIEEVAAAVERIDDLAIPEGETVLGAGRPYWESLREYDPLATAAALERPLFLGQGGRDYQVTVDEDLGRWREALSGENATFETYPDLNHLFLPGEGSASPAEYYEPGHVAPAVVTDVAGFVTDATGTGSAGGGGGGGGGAGTVPARIGRD